MHTTKKQDHQVRKSQGRAMGSTSDGHMVANKHMSKGGNKMPAKNSKKGY